MSPAVPRSRLTFSALTLALTLPAAGALGASRPHFGGTATLAYAGAAAPTDPLLADPPAVAALLQLTASSLCRADAQGTTLELARALVQDSPTQLSIVLAPGLRASAGAPLTALDVATAWARTFTEASPYRALFAPLRGGERALRGAARGRERLSLPLAFPWPDLARSLCHPALAVTVPAGFGARRGVGPFVGSKGALLASRAFPAGRPFLDRLEVAVGDERTAARQLGLGRAQLSLNGEAQVEGPLRFATYLLFRPGRVGKDFRTSVEQALDRADLVRLFVRAPAAPMPALLPGAVEPSHAPGLPEPPEGPLSLVYDTTLDSQRGVAERLALKLHDRGYDVRLLGVSRAQLRERWAKGDYDLMLHAVLLPSEDGPALAVALTLAGQEALLPRELPPIGALPDLTARDALALERASALSDLGAAVPLYVQGVRLKLGPNVVLPPLDALGVPDLSNASLALEGQLLTGGR